MMRRAFLRAGGASGLIALANPAALASAPRPRPWGLQLFTVLPLLEQDFEGTLRAVAALGYREVETIGAFGRDPAYVRRLLDHCGLVSPSQHLASDALYASFARWAAHLMPLEDLRRQYVAALRPETVEPLVRDAIAKAKVLGQSYVVWPILMAPHLATRQLIDAFTARFNRAGAICRDEGLTFAYHNHNLEFATIDGQVIYDLITDQTDPQLVKLEMDLYWVTKGGADPIAYLKRNAGRVKLIHLKDAAPDGDFAPVGSGTLDIPRLVGAARAQGAEHIYVEFDRSTDPLRVIRESIDYLQRLG